MPDVSLLSITGNKGCKINSRNLVEIRHLIISDGVLAQRTVDEKTTIIQNPGRRKAPRQTCSNMEQR
jgi:hypothetical protein